MDEIAGTFRAPSERNASGADLTILEFDVENDYADNDDYDYDNDNGGEYPPPPPPW
jgi:hypothetical protein